MNNSFEMDLLSKAEMQATKGGIWVYDEYTDTWYWIETKSIDPEEK